jgi:hypothetical protein
MKMTPASLLLAWRTFDEFPSGPEAASVAASCSFSLATLEVAVLHDCSGFAIIERKQAGVWRWAVAGKDGSLLEEGCEATQAEAKRAAAEVLNLAEQEDDEPLAVQMIELDGAAGCGTSLPATG